MQNRLSKAKLEGFGKFLFWLSLVQSVQARRSLWLSAEAFLSEQAHCA